MQEEKVGYDESSKTSELESPAILMASEVNEAPDVAPLDSLEGSADDVTQGMQKVE